MSPDPPSLVCLCKLDIHVTPLLKILPTGLNSVMVNSCTKALKPRVTCRFSVTNQLLQAFADKYDCQDGTLCVQSFAHPFPTFLTRVAALLGTIKWKEKIREQNKCYRVQCMQQIITVLTQLGFSSFIIIFIASILWLLCMYHEILGCMGFIP